MRAYKPAGPNIIYGDETETKSLTPPPPPPHVVANQKNGMLVWYQFEGTIYLFKFLDIPFLWLYVITIIFIDKLKELLFIIEFTIVLYCY
jgi:hypothetical protein